MKKRIKGVLGIALVGCVVVASAQNVFPLRLDLDVSTKRHRKNIGAGSHGEAKVEQVQVRVKIRKSGGQPYNEMLTGELYIIGRQVHTDHYGIIDVIKKEFYLTKENKNTFEFNSRTYALGKTSGNINVGGKYETFLLVVVDKDGKIVETRSGRRIKDQGIATVREWKRGTLFDRDGNVVGFVDENGKNKAFKMAVPAAVSGNNW